MREQKIIRSLVQLDVNEKKALAIKNGLSVNSNEPTAPQSTFQNDVRYSNVQAETHTHTPPVKHKEPKVKNKKRIALIASAAVLAVTAAVLIVVFLPKNGEDPFEITVVVDDDSDIGSDNSGKNSSRISVPDVSLSMSSSTYGRQSSITSEDEASRQSLEEDRNKALEMMRKSIEGNEYTTSEAEELQRIIDSYTAKIIAAKTEAEINELYAEAVDELKEVSGMFQQNLEEGRSNAIVMMKNSIAENEYRLTEYEQINSILDTYTEKINAAKTAAEVNKLYAEAVEKLKKIKTNAELNEESSGNEASGSQNTSYYISHTRNSNYISAGGNHTVGINPDGTAAAAGYNDVGQCDVSGWKDIAAVAAGDVHTVGLKSNGRAVATGYNFNGQCNVSGWTDITAVSAGSVHTVGLKSDGTVVAAGYNYNGQCDVSDWKNITAVAAGYYHTVGLKSDGTVVAVGNNAQGQCDVSGWKDIVAISAGKSHTVGLKSDGTVVCAGDNYNKQCDTSSWSGIVAISAGYFHTVGLKYDGTVVAAGANDDGRCNVSGWKDIAAVSAGHLHTIGLKADGTVVSTGGNSAGQCNVSEWKLKYDPVASAHGDN